MMKSALTLQGTKQKLTICLLENPKEAEKVSVLLHEYQKDIGIDLSFDEFEGNSQEMLNRYNYPNGLFFWPKVMISS
jgi:hypothetical protein